MYSASCGVRRGNRVSTLRLGKASIRFCSFPAGFKMTASFMSAKFQPMVVIIYFILSITTQRVVSTNQLKSIPTNTVTILYKCKQHNIYFFNWPLYLCIARRHKTYLFILNISKSTLILPESYFRLICVF